MNFMSHWRPWHNPKLFCKTFTFSRISFMSSEGFCCETRWEPLMNFCIMSRAWPPNVVTGEAFWQRSRLPGQCAIEEGTKVTRNDSLAQSNHPSETKWEHTQDRFILTCAWSRENYSPSLPFKVWVRHLAKRGLFSVLKNRCFLEE